MNAKLRPIGLLVAPVLFGLSSVQFAIAGDESSFDYCHGATDFKGCMMSERDGTSEELRILNEKLKTEKGGRVWLVLHKGWGVRAALEKIEMIDMGQCEIQGVIWKSSTRVENDNVSKYLGYECIEGK